VCPGDDCCTTALRNTGQPNPLLLISGRIESKGCQYVPSAGQKERGATRTGPATSRVEEKLWSTSCSTASFK
jgi:hypothetical protein